MAKATAGRSSLETDPALGIVAADQAETINVRAAHPSAGEARACCPYHLECEATVALAWLEAHGAIGSRSPAETVAAALARGERITPPREARGKKPALAGELTRDDLCAALAIDGAALERLSQQGLPVFPARCFANRTIGHDHGAFTHYNCPAPCCEYSTKIPVPRRRRLDEVSPADFAPR